MTGQKGEVRGQERNLEASSRARRPAPQPAFPRAECSASGLPGGWGERARAGPGGGAPAGRGWAGRCAWVSAILGGGRRAAYL